MAYSKMTIKERTFFLGTVANSLLNDAGRAAFYSGHYWRVGFNEFLTHDVLNGTEAELARLIQMKEFQK